MTLKSYILSKNKDYQFKIVKFNKIDKNFLKLLKKTKFDFDKFRNKTKVIDKKMIGNFIFILRVLDFQLWKFNNNWSFNGEKGFYGLLERLKKLFIYENLEKIKFEDFQKIISPNEDQSLAKVRYKIFRQCLSWLKNNYDSNFDNYFLQNQKPIDFCLNLTKIDKFKDYYQNFYFLKPNQLLYLEYILAKNLLSQFKKNLEELTIFADMIIPQIFINFNLIQLPSNYLIKIKNRKLIKKFSILENELRWASIILGEEIAKTLDIPSFKVDNLLWNLGFKIKLKIPYPKVKTIFY